MRQICHLRQKVKEEDIKGVIHHSKGRESARRTPKITEEKIKQLYRNKYSGFNISHFTEYLNNNDERLDDEGLKLE